MLGLTYSLEASEKAFILHPGRVLVPNLTHFFPTPDTSKAVGIWVDQNTAHTYGMASANFNSEPAKDGLTGKPFRGISQDPLLFYGQSSNQTAYWQHIFYDRNMEKTASSYSNRSINATATCKSFTVISGGDGKSTSVTYLSGNTTKNLFVKYVAPRAMTYITETKPVCGSRCAQVWVYQSQPSDAESGTVLDCTVKLTGVKNAHLPEHELPDDQARIAAGAIGLEGIVHENDTRQYSLYPAG